METIHKTINKCKCIELNQVKLDILHELRKWLNASIAESKKSYYKGKTIKEVYHEQGKNVHSTYKCKVANTAARLFLEECKEADIQPKQNIHIYGNSSKYWVTAQQIKRFELVRNYGQFFQLKVEFVLPFEIKSHKTLSLMAKVPKKLWKYQGQVYKDGFNLVIKNNEVEIHLIEKKEVELRPKCKIKAIYASPYGGLHTATHFDLTTVFDSLEEINPETIEAAHNKLKEYYGVAYGVSKESKGALKILSRLKSLVSKKQFAKDAKELTIKCKTRVNKFFKSMDKSISTIVFVKVSDNTSKVTELIQETMLEQTRKLCEENGIRFEIVEFTQKELNESSLWCMRKALREEHKANSKPAGSMYKPVAGLRQYLYKMHGIKVRLGISNIMHKMKHNEMFSSNEASSTPEMSQVDQTIIYEDNWS